MASTCIDPRLGERLLEELRGMHSAFPLGLTAHLESCEACRISVERAKRLGRTWMSVDPTAAEVAAAHRRFAASQQDARKAARFPAMIAVAIVLAGTAAFGAARVGVLRSAARATLPPPAPAVTGPSMPQGLRRAKPGSVNDAPTVSSLASSEAAPVMTETTTALPQETMTAPPERHLMPPIEAPPAHVGATVAAPGVSAATIAPETPSTTRLIAPAPAAPSASLWEAAASAMRTGDYALAERAFGELAHATDARTRDEARLARAQLLVAQGRRTEARPDLESLVATGATPLVRARAADALDSMGQAPLNASPAGN